MGKKFKFKWNEEAKIECEADIEADSEKSALEIWKSGEYEYIFRSEFDCSSEEPEISEVLE